MSVTIKHEDITPALAKKYLALSMGNRRERENDILAYALQMTAGKWDPDVGEIVFDEEGKLIDGHHRLNAIVLSEATVRIFVKRGLSTAARGLIDTGTSRNVPDMLKMFRHGVSYPSNRKAYLTVCVRLASKGRATPPIKTLEAYDTWMRQFRGGIDWVVDALASISGIASRDKFRVAPVAGAFAFAHKTNPVGVEAFFARATSGIGLNATDPELTLNRLVLSHKRELGGGAGRHPLSLKVLNALAASLQGRPYRQAKLSDSGLDYFLAVYETASMGKLTEPWPAVLQ